MIVQEMMIDYSPIWISFKCAAFSIFITFFLGLFVARWMMTLKNKVIQLIFDGIFTLPGRLIISVLFLITLAPRDNMARFVYFIDS